jgi:hypothetical protein
MTTQLNTDNWRIARRYIAVRAIYPYNAQSADELVLQVGDVLVLSPDGDRYADGWFEGAW